MAGQVTIQAKTTWQFQQTTRVSVNHHIAHIDRHTIIMDWTNFERKERKSIFDDQTCQSVGEEDKVISLCLSVPVDLTENGC